MGAPGNFGGPFSQGEKDLEGCGEERIFGPLERGRKEFWVNSFLGIGLIVGLEEKRLTEGLRGLFSLWNFFPRSLNEPFPF